MQRRFLWRLRLSWRVWGVTPLVGVYGEKSSALRPIWPPRNSDGSYDCRLASLSPRGVGDRDAPIADEIAHLVGRFRHHDLGSGRERDDGAGVSLDRHDQVRIQLERLGLPEPVEFDHVLLLLAAVKRDGGPSNAVSPPRAGLAI